jgi:hypothetical protein
MTDSALAYGVIGRFDSLGEADKVSMWHKFRKGIGETISDSILLDQTWSRHSNLLLCPAVSRQKIFAENSKMPVYCGTT